MKKTSVKHLAWGAVTAALYAALTLLSASMGLAIGPFELRFSEALVILPLFTPAAVPGLFCGCIVANVLCGAHIIDIVFGSVATLIGAVGTRLLKDRPSLAVLPPILSNTLIIPPILYFVYGFSSVSLPLLFLTFFVGEALSAGLMGILFKKALTPFQKHFL